MANNENFAELYENSLKKLEEGTIVDGTVVDIVGDDIFVDLGYKADGIIPRDEFSYSDEIPSSKYKVGDAITAYILKMNNGQGNILLSTKRLQRKKLQEDFEAAVKADKAIEAKVTDVVKGGVIAENGATKIFIPQGQLAERVEDLNECRGKNLVIKVIEYNPEKRKIVGSERKVVKELRDLKQAQTWATIEEGKTLRGTVRQLTDYGAFVDIGGVDGLLHISEMSWGRVESPKKVFNVGDNVRVFIKEINDTKIALSMKFPAENPWNGAAEKFAVGNVVKGVVARMTDFGAFVELAPGVDALLHVSQISKDHVEKPSDALKVGQEVEAKVVDFNEADKKISLSIKALFAAEEPAEEAVEEVEA